MLPAFPFSSLPAPSESEAATVLLVDDNTQLIPKAAMTTLSNALSDAGRSTTCDFVQQHCPASEQSYSITSCLAFALFRSGGADVAESCNEDLFRKWRDEQSTKLPWLSSSTSRTSLATWFHGLTYEGRFGVTGVHEITRWNTSDSPPSMKEGPPAGTRIVCTSSDKQTATCSSCMLNTTCGDEPNPVLDMRGTPGAVDAFVTDSNYTTESAERLCRSDVIGSTSKCLCSDAGFVAVTADSSLAGQQVPNGPGYKLGPFYVKYSERLLSERW